MAIEVAHSAPLLIELQDVVKVEGKVKWFSDDKGYGFITDENDKDYYFAVRDVVGDSLPSRGDTVSFEPKETRKGPRAARVSILERRSVSNSSGRALCQNCGMSIIPRIITYKGVPEHSVCPFCGCTHNDFSEGLSIIEFLKPICIVTLGLVVFTLIYAWIGGPRF